MGTKWEGDRPAPLAAPVVFQAARRSLAGQAARQNRHNLVAGYRLLPRHPGSALRATMPRVVLRALMPAVLACGMLGGALPAFAQPSPSDLLVRLRAVLKRRPHAPTARGR